MIVVVRDDDAFDRPSTPQNNNFPASEGSPMSDISTANTSKCYQFIDQ
jgi:hypothetical protein